MFYRARDPGLGRLNKRPSTLYPACHCPSRSLAIVLLCSFNAVKICSLFIWGTDPSLYTLPPTLVARRCLVLSRSLFRFVCSFNADTFFVVISFFWGGGSILFSSRAGSSPRQQHDGRAVPHKANVGASADDRIRLARSFLKIK